MKKIFSTLIVSTISVFAVSAQIAPSLLVPTDAATLGRAGATIAASANAYSLRANPAMMSFQDGRLDAAASYGMWGSSDSRKTVISFAAACKLGNKLGLGIDFNSFGMPSYNIVSTQGIAQQVNGTFKPSEMNIGLGLSYKFIDCLSAGVDVKFVSSKLSPDAKASAIAADIALAYSNDALKAGLGVCNIGSKLKYGQNSYGLPSYARAGASYSIIGLTVQAEVDYLFTSALMAGLSAEYWFKDIVGARIGYHYGDSKKALPSYTSVGLGAQFKGVHFDFGYLLGNKVLGGTMNFTLGYHF